MLRLLLVSIACLSLFGVVGATYSANNSDNEVHAAWWTKKFSNPKGQSDAARAVYGIDGTTVFSRMFDYKIDGYKIGSGRVWIDAKETGFKDKIGYTWGTHQTRSNIRVTGGSGILYKDRAGYGYCNFVKS